MMQEPPTLASCTAASVPRGIDLFGFRWLRQTLAGTYRPSLRPPVTILLVVLIFCGLALPYAQQFAFDASTDTLIAEQDPELAYYEQMVETFGEASFLVLTYTPLGGPLLVPHHIEQLQALERDLLELPGVADVASILDAPLLRSPPVPLTALGTDYKTLRRAAVDLRLAEQELTTSPLFKELLISADGQSTVLRINLEENAELAEARERRDSLRARRVDDAAYTEAVERYNRLAETNKTERREVIRAVRSVREKFTDQATLHLGGVPMVATDMIDFIKNDIAVFGFGMLLMVVVALYTFFRRVRWVLIPLGTTAVTVWLLVGLLGFLEQPVTAISSNFVALVAIITISFTIHLIVRYMELSHNGSSDDHAELVYETLRSKLAPCLYTALTTVVAFASLLTSDIVPVVDFGWIMCAGILISLLVTYSFFASVLLLLPKGKASTQLGKTPKLTLWFSRMAVERPNRTLMLALVAAVVAVYGITQVSLDSRFIEYFRSGTEIRDGMTFIDRKLGGTIPMDIVVKFPPFEPTAGAGDGFDDFDDFGAGGTDPFPSRYWFTPQKLQVLERLSAYLDARPEVGKSVSLTNLEQIARDFNDGEPLDHLQLIAVLSVLPEDIRQSLIDPYAAPESGQLRIATRLHETGPSFSRQALIDDIKRFATQELHLDEEAVRVTGVAVLFNNMINQLFDSQRSTLLFVVAATLIMFFLLLRSLRLAIIGLLPNLLAAAAILAVMGYVGVSLDLMTIMIAAIVIGIGVDDAIHYLHRFREEVARGHDVRTAVRNSHRSIGSALYFTTLTIVIGFSVLGLSNFIPTISFGVFTGLAMLFALVANLTVLPSLLVKFYK